MGFVSFALQDYTFAGIGAGTVVVLCMNPLDLLTVRLSVDARARRGASDPPSVISRERGGYSIPWPRPERRGQREQLGAFFALFAKTFPAPRGLACIYNQLKCHATVQVPETPLYALQYLLFSPETSPRPSSSLFRSPLTRVFGNFNGYPDKPDVGGEGAHVYCATELAHSAQGLLQCVSYLSPFKA